LVLFPACFRYSATGGGTAPLSIQRLNSPFEVFDLNCRVMSAYALEHHAYMCRRHIQPRGIGRLVAIRTFEGIPSQVLHSSTWQFTAAIIPQNTTNMDRNQPNMPSASVELALPPNFKADLKSNHMKQLEKLVTKKVASPETVKGGRAMALEFFLEDQERTTENYASWNGQHYVTDTRNDPNK
jgi:hypothetical protein